MRMNLKDFGKGMHYWTSHSSSQFIWAMNGSVDPHVIDQKIIFKIGQDYKAALADDGSLNHKL